MSDLDTLLLQFMGIDPSQLQSHRTSYPPYNVVKLSDDSFVVSLAVAGFGKDDIDVVFKEGELTIKGTPNEALKDLNYLHKGVATRKFEQRFNLDKYMEVDGVKLQDGMLHVKLVKHVPEEMKPKKIPIEVANGVKKLSW